MCFTLVVEGSFTLAVASAFRNVPLPPLAALALASCGFGPGFLRLWLFAVSASCGFGPGAAASALALRGVGFLRGSDEDRMDEKEQRNSKQQRATRFFDALAATATIYRGNTTNT